MSSYTALNATLNATCAGHVAAFLEAAVDDVALMARASSLVRGRPLIDEAALAALGSPATLRPFAPPEIAALRATLTARGHALPALSPTTEDSVVRTAAEVFEAASQEVLVGAVLRAIATPEVDFGSARVRRGEQVVTLDARRGDSALLVRVTRDGRVERDWLVAEGEDCHALDDALDRELRRQGIDFDVIVEDHHGGRTDDARLFGPSLRRDAADPARGAVLDAERPLPSTPAPAPTTPARTRRVVRRHA